MHKRHTLIPPTRGMCYASTRGGWCGTILPNWQPPHITRGTTPAKIAQHLKAW